MAVLDFAARVFRDWNTYGVPASGPHDPIKAEIRGLFAQVVTLIGSDDIPQELADDIAGIAAQIEQLSVNQALTLEARDEAILSAAQAAADAASAQAAKITAEAARDEALAAAELTGPFEFFATKAEANAALAGLSNGQQVQVWADESQGGDRTAYVKTAGVYVLQSVLAYANRTGSNTDGPAFLSNIGGDDADNIWLPSLVTGAPLQTVTSAFDERVTIGRLLGDGVFDPNGADNTDAIQEAMILAAADEIGLIFPPSLSLISDAIFIDAAIPLVGPKGIGARFRRMVAADAVFTAENLAAGPSYFDLAFENDPLAPAYVSDPNGVTEAYGRFVKHTRVHGVHAERVLFDGRNGDGDPGIFAAFQNLYGDDQHIIGLTAIGILGNVCGPNGDGAGVGGKRHRYSFLKITGGGDTGVGAWTGALDFVIDQFYIEPVSVADDSVLDEYTKVGIDCAGATNVRIGTGTIRGGTIGVRIASNDVGGGTVYHNDDIYLSEGLRLLNQEASTAGVPEPGQAVKISHTGPAKCRFTSRAHMETVSPNYGILGYVTNATGTLDIDVDKTRAIGTGTAYKFQGAGAAGILRYRPGTVQTKDFNTAGGAVTTGNGTDAGSITVDDPRQNVVVAIGDGLRDFASFNNTATLNKLAVESLTAGYYRVEIQTGAMSDVAGGVMLQLLDGGVTTPISAANANSKLEYFVNLTIDYTLYEISYTSTAGGNNYAFKRVLIQKLT